MSGFVLVGGGVSAGDVGICWCGEGVLDALRDPVGQTPAFVIGGKLPCLHHVLCARAFTGAVTIRAGSFCRAAVRGAVIHVPLRWREGRLRGVHGCSAGCPCGEGY